MWGEEGTGGRGQDRGSTQPSSTGVVHTPGQTVSSINLTVPTLMSSIFPPSFLLSAAFFVPLGNPAPYFWEKGSAYF